MRRTGRVGALALGLVACGLFVSACGSSSNSSSTQTSSEAGSGVSSAQGKQKATAYVKAETEPTIHITEKISKPIPSGVTIDYMSCSYPSCITLGKEAAEAGDKLGWKLKYVNGGLTPSAYQQAAGAIVRDKPDVAVIAGLESTDIRTEVQQMKAEGVKVVGFATNPLPEIAAMVRPPQWNVNYGKTAAAYVISHASEASPTIGFANTAGFFASQENSKGVHGAATEFCPSCKVNEYDLPSTSVGKDAPSLIVNWLRGNPSIKWVILDTDGEALGLPAALRAAGLTGIKLVSTFPSSVSIPLLKNGEMQAVIASNEGASSWNTIDAIARLQTGVSLTQSTSANAVPLTVVEQSNVGSELPPGPEGYQEHFLGLWGKG